MTPKGLLKFLRPRILLGASRGYCTVCSRPSLFLPTDKPETIRNHALCIRCRSCSRNRHIAKHILEVFGHRGAERISNFRNHPELKVYNASSASPIAKQLGKAGNITCSEYFDGLKPGEFKDGVMNQDIRNLTFADDSIDLIISEDVMEHVPDYQAGFREVHRVLKKGGKHIFSIPFYFDRPTRELFKLQDGKPILFEPIEYHGDPVRGEIPCFTHIGYDAIGILDRMGFNVKIEFSHYVDEIRFGIFDCYTFVTEKR